MMTTLLSRRKLLVAGTASAVAWSTANAALPRGWPARPITYIVPYAAGGGSDMVARLLSPFMGEALGTPIVVVNKPGAGGNIGAAAIAQASSDGYTIGGGSVASHAINGGLYERMPYHMERDFTPITLAGTMPNLLIVNAATPYRSVADLVSAGRASTSRLSYASAGNGTSQHLCMELFKQRMGIEAVHIPYKGAGPALQAVIAGETDCSFENLAVVAPHLAAGRIRVLAISSGQRLASLPDIATVAEACAIDFEVMSWQALFAPAQLPAEILTKISAAAIAALKQPEIEAKFAALGMQVSATTPQELGRFQRAEVQKWAAVLKAAQIKPS